ncbi:AmmeMemoRadiSam system protein B [candidate division KSB1 bacterium]|nr:AmmeMemoRadiSam system protein B [candidate division KSB1 bacterium]
MTIKRIHTLDYTNELSKDDFTVYPKLRGNIEPFASQAKDGNVYIGLKDNLELTGEQLWLSQDLFYLLQFFDGSHSCLEIRSEYMKKFGKILYENRLHEFINILDKAFLLENFKYSKKLEQLRTEYRKLPYRQMVCAGSSYPNDPVNLADRFDQLIESVKSNGILINHNLKNINAIIAPHIDIRLGGSTFAHSYYHLLHSKPVDLFVILGIGHSGIDNLFALTDKDFNTPFGVVQTDTNLVNEINNRCDIDFLSEELVHRDEHSIEFQTLFLKHFFKNFKILPILCSFNHSVFNASTKKQTAIFRSFTDSVKSVLSEFSGNVCFIASVDLAHVGLKYGDPEKPDHVYLANVERNDREILNSLADFDQTKFQKIISSNDDKYHICGYSALTTLMELLSPAKGFLLDYNYAVMDENKSTVTFASMIFG